jgi:hypothetical protein
MWKIILYILYCKHKNTFILFIINLFIILLVQIANKMGSQKKLNFCGHKCGRS